MSEQSERLFTLILYRNGTLYVQGQKPDNMGDVLRILAKAADEGSITWVDVDKVPD